MELPDDAPRFPKLPFLLGDAALIAVALYVAIAADSPLPAAAIYTIAACVGLGALLAVVPFIIDFNRRQEALLSARQDALESLSRTTAAAAEQASIAAGGLQEMAELAQKNLRLAEQLPQKLHERANEFNQVRNEAMAAELEALQQEVNTLRASEAEKLESAADRALRAVAELVKAEHSLKEQVKAIETAARQSRSSLEAATVAAVAAVEKKLSDLNSLSTAEPRPRVAVVRTVKSDETPATPPTPPAGPASASPSNVGVTPLRPPPERERVEPKTGAAAPAAGGNVTADEVGSEPPGNPSAHAEAGRTSAPAALSNAATPAAAAEPLGAGSTPAQAAVEAPPIARKPAPRRRPAEQDTPMLGGLLEEESAAVVLANDPAAPATISKGGAAARTSSRAPVHAAVAPHKPGHAKSVEADGATRLLVTAYIGIGNRLFVRGDGPGLSRDRGTPLEFVSIGKWRWETKEATAPVSLKLFKNDEVECAAIGELQLQPGDHREVTATF